MSEPTKKQKQLAEEILRKFGNPDYTEEELTEEIPIVAQILADAQAEERQFLVSIGDRLRRIQKDQGPFSELKDIIDCLTLILK